MDKTTIECSDGFSKGKYFSYQSNNKVQDPQYKKDADY